MRCPKCGGKGFIEYQGGTIMVKCEACVEGIVSDEEEIVPAAEETVVIAETTPIEEPKPKPKRKYKRRKKRVKK